MDDQLKIFVSYTQADRGWAEWIAWQLEDAGHQVRIQAWDFQAGTNFVDSMNKASLWADATMPVLSPAYLQSGHSTAEWTAKFAKDPLGEKRSLLPVRVRDFDVEGLLGAIVYINLVKLGPERAREALLSGLVRERRKPKSEPAFPGTASETPAPASAREAPRQEPEFPRFNPIGVPRNNHFFTGRDELLTQLHQRLESADASRLAQAAINGIGGIGKSQLAIEYAHRYGEGYRFVLWATAKHRETLDESYSRLARRLELAEHEESLDRIVEEVKDWLAEHKDWLLIFDAADTPNLVRDYLPARRQGGTVLLTSRADAFFDLGIDQPFKAEKMGPNEAITFLLRKTQNQDPTAEERAAAGRLAKELDYFPLALAQAASYLQRRQVTFEEYLASYDRRGLELLNQVPPGADYPASLATTWNLNFEAVDKVSRATTELFKAAAFLVPDSIPFEIFQKGGSEFGGLLAEALRHADQDSTVFRDLLAPLENYSLAESLPGKAFQVNRLTQKVIQHNLTDEERQGWIERTVKALTKAYPEAKFRTWQNCERLQPHVLAIVESYDEHGLEMAELGDLLTQAGRFARLRGELTSAEHLCRRALEIHQKTLEPEDPRTLESMNSLGEVLFSQGDYVEAHKLHLKAFESRSRQLGAEHPATLDSKGNLGQIHYKLKDYKTAKRYHEETLEVRRREDVLGEEHEDTLASKNNLALALRALNDLEGARKLNQEILDTRLAREEQQHPATLTAMNNLAVTLWLSGDQEGKSMFEKVLALREEVLGPHHPNTTTTAWWLLTIAEEESDDAAVERLLEKLRWLTDIDDEETIASDHQRQTRRYALKVIAKQAQAQPRPTPDEAQ